MKCNQCGKENTENSLFCNGCGAKLQNDTETQNLIQQINDEVQEQPNNNTSPNNKSSKNTMAALIGFGCLMALFAIIFGTKYFIQQYKLRQVDKELQEQINNLGDLESITESSNTKQEVKEYKVGDAVSLLDNSNWHIVSINGENVVLLSDNLALENSPYGNSSNPEDQKYDNSEIKKYLENTYLPSLKTSLSSKNGNVNDLKVRLLKLEEFIPLSNARWVTVTGELKLSSYNIYKTDAGDNFAWLSMTSNFWLQDYIVDSTNDGFFYGAYYIEVTIDESSEYFSSMQIETDQCGSKSTNYSCGAQNGVRPVIETTVKNIK